MSHPGDAVSCHIPTAYPKHLGENMCEHDDFENFCSLTQPFIYMMPEHAWRNLSWDELSVTTELYALLLGTVLGKLDTDI